MVLATEGTEITEWIENLFNIRVIFMIINIWGQSKNT